MPSSLIAMECSQCAARGAVLGDHGPAVGQLPGARPAQGEHRFDGQRGARRAAAAPCPACPGWPRTAPCAWRCRCRARRSPATEPYRRPSSRAGPAHRLSRWRRRCHRAGRRPGPPRCPPTSPARRRRSGRPPPSTGGSPTCTEIARVGMPAVQDAAGVDGEQVALAQDPGRRAGCRARPRRSPTRRSSPGSRGRALRTVMQEVAGGAGLGDDGRDRVVDLPGADAGRHGRAARRRWRRPAAGPRRASPAAHRGS